MLLAGVDWLISVIFLVRCIEILFVVHDVVIIIHLTLNIQSLHLYLLWLVVIKLLARHGTVQDTRRFGRICWTHNHLRAVPVAAHVLPISLGRSQSIESLPIQILS